MYKDRWAMAELLQFYGSAELFGRMEYGTEQAAHEGISSNGALMTDQVPLVPSRPEVGIGVGVLLR